LGRGLCLLAAIVATNLTILSNFRMQERLVFRDMRGGRRSGSTS
jgi:putative flippase GtrA